MRLNKETPEIKSDVESPLNIGVERVFLFKFQIKRLKQLGESGNEIEK